MKILVICVIAAGLLQEAVGEDKIGDLKTRIRCDRENEKFITCGTACPTTCENYKNKPSMCTMQCVSGCFCVSPYIRNSKGDCILPSECKATAIEPQPPICRCNGNNEVYNACGSMCPKTCDTRNITLKCAAGCQSGCFCAPGYLRNKSKKCVLIRNCD